MVRDSQNEKPKNTLHEDASMYNEPPSLNYTLRISSRKRSIAIFAILIFVEAGILPIILFFSLRWGAHLSDTKNLAIITALIGTVSGFKVAQRSWLLWLGKGHASRRPIGAGRWGVDALQIMIWLSMTAFFIPLIIGSSLTPAQPAVVALALPLFMLVHCIPLLLTGLCAGPHAPCAIRVPFRVSSLPAHEPLPPMTYTFVEDIVAVDGGGRTEFRQAWRVRYESSRVMRRLLRNTAVMWGLSGTVLAAALVAAAFTAPTDVGYGCAYGLPWLWLILMTVSTCSWVQRQLAYEASSWASPHVHENIDLHIVEGAHDPPRVAARRGSAGDGVRAA